MKFVCDGTVLANAALIVSKACAVKTITPVLECIRLTAKNDGLTLKAYDGEISIEKKINAEVLEEGELCVNGKTFADFVNKISAYEAVISTNDTGIVIEYGESESFMQALSAADFPMFGENGLDSDYFEIKELDFKKLISEVVFCAATDDSRPILKGCLLQTDENELTATALDGFRMACSTATIVGGSDRMKIVCPARTLTEISRMLDGDDTLRVYASKNLLSVAVKDTVITSRLYLGEFVRKENIYPTEFTTQVTLRKNELLDSIERASVLIRGDKNNLILLDIKPGKIVITANSEMGKVEETVLGEVEGKELKIAMNGKYIMDAVKALSEEEIVLSFNLPVSPFTVENVKDRHCQYLVLPVRTSNS